MSAQTVSLPEVLTDRLQATEFSIAQFCQRWQVQELALFGSVIRDDFGGDSDIDVLVVFEPDCRCGAIARLEMQHELSQLFGRDVDLTEKRLIRNPVSRAEILRSHRIIYPLELANFTGIEAKSTMTENARSQAALLDMVGAMNAVEEFVQGKTFEDYQTDLFFKSAVERQLEILGEAANRLKPAFQTAHSEIDWSGVVGLRNVIIHQYDELDTEEIWQIATEQVPLLLEQIQPLLSDLTEEGAS